MVSRSWRLVEEGPLAPEVNMERDASLLKHLKPDSSPQLKFYEWEIPSATYGYFIDPARFFNPEGVKHYQLKTARRPTGGGILFHHVDCAFSLILPSSHPYYGASPLESYRILNGLVLSALKESGFSESSLIPASGNDPHDAFCMAHPTIYDVVCSGKKIAGAAQRRTRQGLLYQASLCLRVPDPAFLKAVLLPCPGLMESMQQLSYPLALTPQEVVSFKSNLYAKLGDFSCNFTTKM